MYPVSGSWKGGNGMMSGKIAELQFSGVKVLCSLAVWESCKHWNTFGLVSLFGGLSHLRAVHAALVGGKDVELLTGNRKIDLQVSWYVPIRMKHWKFGYQKYHAIIWDENFVQNLILAENQEAVEPAWDRFLKKRVIPYTKQWIPLLVPFLEEHKVVKRASCFPENVLAWKWQPVKDETVCDLVVQEFFK